MTCTAIEKEPNLKIQPYFNKAKVTIDYMTPGIFSLKLIDQLIQLKSKGILIRIISDRTFESFPENLIFDASKHFSIKIIDAKFKIAHNLLIIDQKEAIIGGAYFPAKQLLVDNLASIKDKNKLHNIYLNFQDTWQNIQLSQTRDSLLRFQHYIDVNSSENQIDSNTAPKSGFVASKNGKRYYRVDSKSAKRISDKNRIYFESEELAKNSGRTRARNF